MQDFLFVNFFLGHRRGKRARRLLHDCNLLDAALANRANRHSWSGDVHWGVSLRLPSEDLRLNALLDRLRQEGVEPFLRMDREYSPADLDRADWLILRIATAGLLGGIDYDQAYVPGSGCATCGAGVTPIAPLVADLGKMGKKEFDHLIHEGHLIASSRVTSELGRFTGVEAVPVRSPRRPADARFMWWRITSAFPRMHSFTAGMITENVCPTCERSGHYGDFMLPEAPVYNGVPRTACDFNHTWEYFGNWQQVRGKSNRMLVGGSRGMIVSQRVRQALRSLEVKRLVWVPITILDQE